MTENFDIENNKEFLQEQEQLQNEFKQQQENDEKEQEQEQEQQEQKEIPNINRLYLIQENLIIPLIEGKIKIQENGVVEYTEQEKEILKKISESLESRHSFKIINNDIVDILSLIFIHAPKFYQKFKNKIVDIKGTKVT